MVAVAYLLNKAAFLYHAQTGYMHACDMCITYQYTIAYITYTYIQ